jgi:hypothetical protein
MRIRMLVEKTGPRHDGRYWPGPGGEIDVGDEEGRALCERGDAAPVAQRDADVETRAQAPQETPPQEKAATPATPAAPAGRAAAVVPKAQGGR